MLARIRGEAVEATARVAGTAEGEARLAGREMPGAGPDAAVSRYHGARGMDPALIEQLERQFGFDKPAHQRFLHMMQRYLVFDFGKSFYRDRPVLGLLLEKLPVSISLGLWMTLIAYSISIPLGIRKAVHDGSAFDVWTSGVIIMAC